MPMKYSRKHYGSHSMISPTGESWMSPLNKIIWMKAFKTRQTHVTIRDGRKFVIDYDRPKLKARNWCFVNPDPEYTGEFVPCGEFDLDKVTDPLWVSEDGKMVKDVFTPTQTIGTKNHEQG